MVNKNKPKNTQAGKKNNKVPKKNNTMTYVAVAAVAVAAIAAAAWFVMQDDNDHSKKNYPVTFDGMRDNLKDKGYTLTPVTNLSAVPGAVEGFSFQYHSKAPGHTTADTVLIYRFSTEAAANTYKTTGSNAHNVVLTVGDLGVRIHGHGGDVDKEDKPFFDALMKGKGVPW